MRPLRALPAIPLLFLTGVAFASHIGGGSVLPPSLPLPSTLWYDADVAHFRDAGYLDPGEPLRPNDTALRAEFVRLLLRMQGGSVPTPQAFFFDDVPAGHPAASSFAEAARAGLLRGAGDCLGTHPCFAYPGSPVNRAEAATLILRAFDLAPHEGSPTFRDVTPSAWYAEAVQRAASRCILRGDDARETVRPAATMNRAEMIVMLARAERGRTYPECGDGVSSPGASASSSSSVPETALTIVLSLRNPVGDAVARGAMSIPVLIADFTASCAAPVTIESVTLTRGGQGIPDDSAGLWMRVGASRVSRSQYDEDNLRRVTLRFTDPLRIPACATKPVEFLVNLEDTALIAGRLSYGIAAPEDVFSDAESVGGAFPIIGETFEVGNERVGAVAVTYRDLSHSTVAVDTHEAVVGGLQFTVDMTEDQTFQTITLENQGSAHDGDIAAIFLERTDGAQLTAVATQTVGDYVTLHFDPPYTVQEGATINLDLRADIVDGDRRTVQLALEEVSDLFVTGSRFGYGANGQLYGSHVTVTGSPDRVTIEGGEEEP